MKLFEIPVYAISEDELLRKYKKQPAYETKMNKPVAEMTNLDICLDKMALPYRRWDYNHIVGYISIFTDYRDVCLKVYLPVDDKKRYVIDSTKKTFLYDIEAGGTHFRVDEEMTNSDIRESLLNELLDIQKTHIPKRYYIDREAFDTLNPFVDYKAILDKH